MSTTPGSDPTDDQEFRRPSLRSRKFAPRTVAPSAEESVLLQRNILRSSASASKHQTERRHEVAQELPGWEPMPPGELFVQRPRHG